MDPIGILTSFGLFYAALSGAFYGIPMAMQPMKAASAAVLIDPMEPAAIAGAGLVIGAFFLILGMTGVVSRLARALPGSIAAALQLGLGLSLAGLGVRLIETQGLSAREARRMMPSDARLPDSTLLPGGQPGFRARKA
jgi:predicted benzoate:H+ symporter BenE